MSPSPRAKRAPQFTRGEKCIFVHCVVTCALLLALVVLWFAHLLATPHASVRDALRVTRRSQPHTGSVVTCALMLLALVVLWFMHLLAKLYAGARHALRVKRRSQPRTGSVVTCALMLALVVLLFALLLATPPRKRVETRVWARAGRVRAGGRAACGGVLVRARWAAAPAHCVAARARPTLAQLVPAWTIAYRLTDDLRVEPDIIRGVVHSHFNGDDFSNNIGLFEQAYSIFMDDYRLPTAGVSDGLARHTSGAAVARWGATEGAGMPAGLPVKTMSWQTCRQFLAPVVQLRTNEFCVHSQDKNFTVEHGALVVFGSAVQGFVAWGDTEGNLPLVVLDISSYLEWIDNAIAFY